MNKVKVIERIKELRPIIEVDPFTIASVGKYGLYELTNNALGEHFGVYVDIENMKLFPLFLVDDERVAYEVQIVEIDPDSIVDLGLDDLPDPVYQVAIEREVAGVQQLNIHIQAPSREEAKRRIAEAVGSVGSAVIPKIEEIEGVIPGRIYQDGMVEIRHIDTAWIVEEKQ